MKKMLMSLLVASSVLAFGAAQAADVPADASSTTSAAPAKAAKAHKAKKVVKQNKAKHKAKKVEAAPAQ